jgi:hypothetical protein
VGDKAYFNKLAKAIQNGGANQFLHFLLNVKLGRWHPRDIIKTKELADHQLASLSTTFQWLLACAEDESVSGNLTSIALNSKIATSELYKRYCEWAKQHVQKPEHKELFGTHLREILSPCRLPADKTWVALNQEEEKADDGIYEDTVTKDSDKRGSTKKIRAWGYVVPDGVTLRTTILKKKRIERT